MKTLLWFLSVLLFGLGIFLSNEDKTMSIRFGLAVMPMSIGTGLYAIVSTLWNQRD